jgi:hypothetical protein
VRVSQDSEARKSKHQPTFQSPDMPMLVETEGSETQKLEQEAIGTGGGSKMGNLRRLLRMSYTVHGERLKGLPASSLSPALTLASVNERERDVEGRTKMSVECSGPRMIT